MTDNAKRDWGWPLLLVFFAIVAGAFVTRSLLGAGDTPLLADTDDAMRLVTVRDFLAGQDWYDNIQHRLNTPFGAEMHWSRLVDLPIAGLFLLLQPFAGTGTSVLVAYVWPLLLLFGLLALSALLSGQLVGRQGRLAAVALPALSLIAMVEFAPGRLDHHSIQILLMFGLVSASIAALRRPPFALLAGVLAATAIAIGIEGLPTVAAAIACFGLIWVLRPASTPALRLFGLSFALGTLAHLAIALPPQRWFTPACDAISIVYAAAAIGVGIVYVVLSLLPMAQRSPASRLGLLILGGVAVAVTLGVLFPTCLRGPYGALDPWLVDNWLKRIGEAAPFWDRLLSQPSYPLGVALPAFIGLGVVVWQLARGPRETREAWLVYGIVLLAAIVVMLVQIRACRFATLLAVPGCAWLIVAARQRYLASRSIASIAGLVGAWLAPAGLAVALLVNLAVMAFPDYDAKSFDAEAKAGKSACLLADSYADLAGLPPERIMTPIDLGAHMLAYTPHAVVSAPYHRNQDGIRDTLNFFNEPIDEARVILDMRGIGLVVTCADMPELASRTATAADSFIKLQPEGRLPDWLVLQSAPEAALQVYSVRR